MLVQNFNKAKWDVNFLAENGTIGSKTSWCSRLVRTLSNVPVIGGLFPKNDPVVGLSTLLQSMRTLIANGATPDDEDLVKAAAKASDLGQYVLGIRKSEDPKLSSMVEKIQELVKVSPPEPPKGPEVAKDVEAIQPQTAQDAPNDDNSVSPEVEAAFVAAADAAEKEAAARKAAQEQEAAKSSSEQNEQPEVVQVLAPATPSSSSLSEPQTPPAEKEVEEPKAPQKKKRRNTRAKKQQTEKQSNASAQKQANNGKRSGRR